MASVTLTLPEEIKKEVKELSWINWSELAKKEINKKKMLEELHEQLDLGKEKELIEWSVKLGAKAKKGRLKKILSELSEKEKKEL